MNHLALGISIFLALLAWFVHNMSLSYSSVAQYTVIARSSIDAHSDISSNSARIAARCELTGYQLLHAEFFSFRHRSRTVFFAPEYFRHRSGDIYYLDKSALTRYFHEIFGDGARLEYFITDSVFFDFPKMDYKKVPVHVASDISFRSQYMASTPLKIMPDSLLVYGSDEILKGIDRLNTKVIQLRDVDSDCFGEVGLERIPNVRVSASKVGYSMNVTRYVEEKFTLPVRLEGARPWIDFEIVPSSASVTVRIPFSSSDFSPKDFSLKVSWDDVSASRSGACIPSFESTADDILQYRIEPEVFTCIVH